MMARWISAALLASCCLAWNDHPAIAADHENGGRPARKDSHVLSHADFLASVATHAGEPAGPAGDFVEAIRTTIADTIVRCEKVKVSGFGKFVIRRREAGKAVEPESGREVIVEEKRVLTFKPSLELKNKLNEAVGSSSLDQPRAVPVAWTDSSPLRYAMTKSGLADAVASAVGSSREDATRWLNAFFAAVTEALVEGRRVEMRGLGSWFVKIRHERQGRHPVTGELVHFSTKKTPFFRTSRELRDRLRASTCAPEPEVTSS